MIELRYKAAPVQFVGVDPLTTFSDRLRALHQRVFDPATGKPFTQRAVVAWLAENRGVDISASYFNQLLHADRAVKPNWEIVQGLLTFYDVSAAYFDLYDSETAPRVLEQLDLLALARDERLQHLMTRSTGDVTPEDVQQLLQVMNQVRADLRTQKDGEAGEGP